MSLTVNDRTWDSTEVAAMCGHPNRLVTHRMWKMLGHRGPGSGMRHNWTPTDIAAVLIFTAIYDGNGWDVHRVDSQRLMVLAKRIVDGIELAIPTWWPYAIIDYPADRTMLLASDSLLAAYWFGTDHPTAVILLDLPTVLAPLAKALG